MSSKARTIGFCLVCFCMLFAWYFSSVAQQHLSQYHNCTSVRWDNEKGASPSDIDRAIQWQIKDGGIPPKLTLWKNQQNQNILSDFNNRSASCQVFQYYGDMSLLYPRRFLTGYWPSDKSGCVVDEATAFALWGSNDVIGRSVEWNDKTWYVRGVAAGNDFFCVFPASPDDQTPFDGILFDLSLQNITAQQLINQYQLPSGTVVDFGLFVWISSILSGFPVLILLGYIIARLIKRVWKIRHAPIFLLISFPVFLLAVVIIFWSAGFPWEIPARFLPTRWSDMEFWSGLKESFLDGIASTLLFTLSVWEKSFWNHLGSCLIFSAVTSILTFSVVRLFRVNNLLYTFAKISIWWIGILILIFFNRNSLYPLPSSTLFLFVPLWMLLQWLLKIHFHWICPSSSSTKEDFC